MSDADSGEKSFAPTEKRIQDAVKKGDVLRSKDVAAAISVIFGGVWLLTAGPWVLGLWQETFFMTFQFDHDTLRAFDFSALMGQGLHVVLMTTLTIAVPVMVAVTFSQMAMGKGRWVTKNLNLKASRINPLSGLKRMFGPTGLIEMGKGILKILLLGAIAALWATAWGEEILGLGRGNLSEQIGTARSAGLSLLAALAGGLVLIGAIDVGIQSARRSKRLKMTHRQMKDENKESEGSPEAKATRRQRQREIAGGGLAHSMKDAQFVLANPTHFSVAIVYDPERAPAPLVLARGRGERALAIREMALEMDVPILSLPQLTRAVYFTSKENQIVREELYAAIASVIAFVYSLKPGEKFSPPAVAVPPMMRFDAEGKQTT